MALVQAHRGYEYQDLLVAVRLIDLMLGIIKDVYVDKKLAQNDIFDDLIIVDGMGYRERIQIKYTTRTRKAITPATFTQDKRRLRLDRVIAAMLADRNARESDQVLYRIVMQDLPPTDPWLDPVQQSTSPDPGPFVHGMKSIRMRFCPNSLDEYFGSVITDSINEVDLEWVFEHLILELDAPDASFDLTNPGPAEEILLKRVRDEVGTGVYPNEDRSAIDVAEALIRSARAARQGSITLSISELLRRTQLRSDFGAVARAHPVDQTIEVKRNSTVGDIMSKITAAADEGKIVLLVGSPGQGKSWICQQVINGLLRDEWFVAEHYCYLEKVENTERQLRVRVESVIGSLIQRIADVIPEVVSEQRPRFSASDHALENAVCKALEKNPDRRIALIVDGIDHVTRVVGRMSAGDPSFIMVEALAALKLPRGSVLIVLSQPGSHLKSIEGTKSVTIHVPNLTDDELKQLAIRLGVIHALSDDVDTDTSLNVARLSEKRRINEFVTALADRSKGNALYATYLCKEILRNPTAMAMLSVAVRQLPQFDESLSGYYQHIHASLGDKGAWVADVIALIDFPVSRNELKEIRPDMAHRVDESIKILQPVLLERGTQAGIRIYHESFARFLRKPFQEDDSARIALLDKIIKWLERDNIFKDTRAYRYLLSLLYDVDDHQKIIDLIGLDFVVESIAAGHPKSAIIENLATAIRSAACTGNWPAVVRYVEMSRSAETYQEERFQNLIVDYIDVAASLLGADSLAEKLLHDGYRTIDAQSGLQICSALDALGAIPPWKEYMRAYSQQRRDYHSKYPVVPARPVNTDWLRGQLRLVKTQSQGYGETSASSSSTEYSDPELFAPLNWELLVREIDENVLSPRDVIEAVLGVLGEHALVEFIEKLSHPGLTCLEFAKIIAAGKASNSTDSASDWAKRAAKCDIPSGHASCLMALGVEVDQISLPVQEARENLLSLTRRVQGYPALRETGLLADWMDACSVAARNDPTGLASAEALLKDPGWYICWLKFTIALVFAEVATTSRQSCLGLEALRILTTNQRPLPDKPRRVDLHRIRSVIYDTLKRVVDLLDDQTWEEGVLLLIQVCDTHFMDLSGPISRNRLLNLIVNTATPTRSAKALAFINDEIKRSQEGKPYSELAELRLIAARLALNLNDPTEVRRHWDAACRLFTAYGWHKDATIFELLDPLHALIDIDPVQGQVAVAKIQPLCERVLQHTDGDGTYRAQSQWWRLLAKADPCALAQLVQQKLLASCNDPNELLHGARSDLWRTWYHGADPIMAGALRLTLQEPLDRKDGEALSLIAELYNSKGTDQSSQLIIALLSRADERPANYSDSGEFSDVEESNLIEDLNSIAARVNLPKIASLPTPPPIVTEDSDASSHRSRSKMVSRPTIQVKEIMFEPGADGILNAVRIWQDRQYEEPLQDRSVDRFANILGYRIIGLIESGQGIDAQMAVRSIANATRFFEEPVLLRSLAEGFERHGAVRLAALAYTLLWTRIRGQGGWLSFGGETGLEFLRRASELDQDLALKTVAEEIEGEFILRPGWTYGITQALIYGFAKGGLSNSALTCFEMWDQGLAVIADRLPQVGAATNSEDVYTAPNPDNEIEFPGDIDAAFAAATVAGLAHPGREQKRRSLLGVQVLINERVSVAISPLKAALSSLSDPATLTWLLRVIELADEKAVPIIAGAHNVLVKLAGSPHLTIRTLARRMISGDIPLVPPIEPEPELIDLGSTDIILPDEFTVIQQDTAVLDGFIDQVAGIRLSRAEQILPRLSKAVYRKVNTVLGSTVHKRRVRAQIETYAQLRHCRPDAFLASEEAIEEVLQKTAGGVCGASLMNYGTVSDPVKLEERLALALLDDPALPLALERTRQPRPDIPPPPSRGDPLWHALLERAEGALDTETGIAAARRKEDQLFATMEISDSETVPVIAGGPYDGWRLVATVEERIIPQTDPRDNRDDIANRYRVIELRLNGDQQALTLPPVAEGDIRTWLIPIVMPAFSVNMGIQSSPVVGYDWHIAAADDGYCGLGIQRGLFTPTEFLVSALGLKAATDFVLEDATGQALALITWRTEYNVSNYHLPYPRLRGAGLVLRNDAFSELVRISQCQMIFRDFVSGASNLCG